MANEKIDTIALCVLCALWQLKAVNDELTSTVFDYVKTKACQGILFDYEGTSYLAIKGHSCMHDYYQQEVVCVFNYTMWEELSKTTSGDEMGIKQQEMAKNVTILPAIYTKRNTFKSAVSRLEANSVVGYHMMPNAFYSKVKDLTSILPATDILVYWGELRIDEYKVCDLFYDSSANLDEYAKQAVEMGVTMYELEAWDTDNIKLTNTQEEVMKDFIVIPQVEANIPFTVNSLIDAEIGVFETGIALGVIPYWLSSDSWWFDTTKELIPSVGRMEGVSPITGERLIFRVSDPSNRYVAISKKLIKAWQSALSEKKTTKRKEAEFATYTIDAIEKIMPEVKRLIPKKDSTEYRQAMLLHCNDCDYVFVRARSETFYKYRESIVVGFNLTEWRKTYKLIESGIKEGKGCAELLNDDDAVAIQAMQNLIFFDETDSLEDFSTVYWTIDGFRKGTRKAGEAPTANKGRKLIINPDRISYFAYCDKTLFEAMKQGIAKLPRDTHLLWYYDSLYIEKFKPCLRDDVMTAGETELCNITFRHMHFYDRAIREFFRLWDEIYVENPNILLSSESHRRYYVPWGRFMEHCTDLVACRNKDCVDYKNEQCLFLNKKLREDYINEMIRTAAKLSLYALPMIEGDKLYRTASDVKEYIEYRKSVETTQCENVNIVPSEIWGKDTQCRVRPEEVVHGYVVCSNKTGESWQWDDDTRAYATPDGLHLTAWGEAFHGHTRNK